MPQPKPLLTRRLRVSFDVEVQVLPPPDRELAAKPDLTALQQALLDNPAMCDKMLAYWALDEVADHLMDMHESAGWMPGDPYDAFLDAVRDVPLAGLRRFLFEGLVHKDAFAHVSELFGEGERSRLRSQARVTDLKTGQELAWAPPTRSIFRQRDGAQRFLLVEVQGETVLCLNLSHPDGLDAALEGASEEVQTAVGSILGFFAGVLSPAAHDDLLVRLAEAFPGLPVEIYATPQAAL